ncbi:hypothetical protein [Streptomyces zagrosensis]|uniref:Uncharacterized protein n=1 Tax=Streptomyces zagrosensis TaxID=1042984 RepID=A0A7W9QEQ2_9ACTN|nr:hypothetical protein [Streptomyces zagrosensis]MBB5937872.1 hypothetical protein [Streptomyces zagrosensis]
MAQPMPAPMLVSQPVRVDFPPGPPRPQPPVMPIYSELAEHWLAAGRTVPGVYDQEWIELVHRPAWPTLD